MQANYVQRIRIVFSKNGPARFIGHLDVARTWERSLNRAKIPMSYTQGFNRRPRMQFAAPLPLGYLSEGEIVDLWLLETMDAAEVATAIMERMAPGLAVVSAETVSLKQPSLPAMTIEASYRANLRDDAKPIDNPEDKLQELISAETITRSKRAKKRGRKSVKTYNLRPLILDAAWESEGVLTTRMQLSSSVGTGRPGELLAAMGYDPLDALISRTTILLDPQKLLVPEKS